MPPGYRKGFRFCFDDFGCFRCGRRIFLSTPSDYALEPDGLAKPKCGLVRLGRQRVRRHVLKSGGEEVIQFVNQFG